MVTAVSQQREGGKFGAMVDSQTSQVDRRIFSDREIYDQELKNIFARAWNFMCHESQIPKPGDFFCSYIGDDSVIATRDKQGELRVLLNTCRHRGNAVCRAEQGHAKSFLCTYHGWTYGLDGALIGVPGLKNFYHNDLDRSQWGLRTAPKVASYKGFVFACMDPDAPELEDFLGPVGRLSIDMLTARGNAIVVDGIQKNVINCNWKIAVDNVFDFYHGLAHMSAFLSEAKIMSAMSESKDAPIEVQGAHRVFFGEYGHALGGARLAPEYMDYLKVEKNDPMAQMRDYYWRVEGPATEKMSSVELESIGHAHVFPNFWVAQNQISLRIPRGPDTTEIWWFTILNEDMTDDQREMLRDRALHGFGPAGLLEQEDGENWDQSTRATRGVLTREMTLNFAMGAGHDEVKRTDSGLVYVDTTVNEHAQMWTYRGWADWMDAASWPDLKKNKSALPEGRI